KAIELGNSAIKLCEDLVRNGPTAERRRQLGGVVCDQAGRLDAVDGHGEHIGEAIRLGTQGISVFRQILEDAPSPDLSEALAIALAVQASRLHRRGIASDVQNAIQLGADSIKLFTEVMDTGLRPGASTILTALIAEQTARLALQARAMPRDSSFGAEGEAAPEAARRHQARITFSRWYAPVRKLLAKVDSPSLKTKLAKKEAGGRDGGSTG
ncbi:hypothetical protein OC844_002814, partial [Tilletia horrida]